MYRRHPENIMVKKKTSEKLQITRRRLCLMERCSTYRPNQVGAEELQYTFLFSAIKNDKEAE